MEIKVIGTNSSNRIKLIKKNSTKIYINLHRIN